MELKQGKCLIFYGRVYPYAVIHNMGHNSTNEHMRILLQDHEETF